MDSSLVKFFLRKKRENDPELQQKDIVILHQFGRGVYAPSKINSNTNYICDYLIFQRFVSLGVSSFALKLETWFE
jgi:hypothetical protein